MYVIPRPYGDFIELYENAERSPAMLAELFRRAFHTDGFARCTADDVRRMPPSVPSLLEYVILKASDVPAVTEDDDDETVDEPDPVEDSLFAAHDEGKKAAEDVRESDLMHSLHERGYTAMEVSGLLFSEIEMLQEGAERAEERSDDADDGSMASTSASTSNSQPHGNRGDLAGQFFGRN